PDGELPRPADQQLRAPDPEPRGDVGAEREHRRGLRRDVHERRLRAVAPERNRQGRSLTHPAVCAGLAYSAVTGIALSINTAAMAAAVGKDSALRTLVRTEAPSSSSANCSPSFSGSAAPASRAVSASRAAMAFL